MLRQLRLVLAALAVCAICAFFSPAASYAGTILEMNLGDDASDSEFGGTTLHTAAEHAANGRVYSG
jgi:hypothetical protein